MKENEARVQLSRFGITAEVAERLIGTCSGGLSLAFLTLFFFNLFSSVGLLEKSGKLLQNSMFSMVHCGKSLMDRAVRKSLCQRIERLRVKSVSKTS